MSKTFRYPNKSLFSALSFTPAEQSVFNEIPRYSITFYDDENFTFKRQSIDGKPVLSKIISDDFYPFNLSFSDRNNYITGQSNTLKVFFAKILVHKSISQDSVGSTSSVFYLTRTQTFGMSKTVYYTVKCIEKNDQFTVYSSRISLSNSDFINQVDGEAFFTLVGDFSVSLNYPINLTISNSATTSITESSTTPIYNTISTSVNNLNFYENFHVDFDYYQYSDSFNFDFSPLNITLTDTIFSTNPNIYTTNSSSGTSIRFNFQQGYSISGLNNFALTITNSFAGYNPEIDTLFTLYIRMSNGEFLTINACEIFNNTQSGYYNVVFSFMDIIWPGNFINYLILEIKTISSSVNQVYTITYMNFVNEVSNLNSFSFKTFSFSNETNYTTDPLQSKINTNALLNKQIISSSEIFSTVDSLIRIKDDANYQITTQSGSIILPETTLIKTDNLYIPVFNLEKNAKLKTINSIESVISIKVLPSSFVDMIDIYDNSDYVLNGFYIKNPFFSANIEREIISKKEYALGYKNIQINGKLLSLKSDKNYAFLDKDITMARDISNEIKIEDAKASRIYILISCSAPVYISYQNSVKLYSDRDIAEIQLKNVSEAVILKSKSSFSIKKLLLLYDF